jgi:hypothetical protein
VPGRVARTRRPRRARHGRGGCDRSRVLLVEARVACPRGAGRVGRQRARSRPARLSRGELATQPFIRSSSRPLKRGLGASGAWPFRGAFRDARSERAQVGARRALGDERDSRRRDLQARPAERPSCSPATTRIPARLLEPGQHVEGVVFPLPDRPRGPGRPRRSSERRRMRRGRPALPHVRHSATGRRAGPTGPVAPAGAPPASPGG